MQSSESSNFGFYAPIDGYTQQSAPRVDNDRPYTGFEEYSNANQFSPQDLRSQQFAHGDSVTAHPNGGVPGDGFKGKLDIDRYALNGSSKNGKLSGDNAYMLNENTSIAEDTNGGYGSNLAITDTSSNQRFIVQPAGPELAYMRLALQQAIDSMPADPRETVHFTHPQSVVYYPYAGREFARIKENEYFARQGVQAAASESTTGNVKVEQQYVPQHINGKFGQPLFTDKYFPPFPQRVAIKNLCEQAQSVTPVTPSNVVTPSQTPVVQHSVVRSPPGPQDKRSKKARNIKGYSEFQKVRFMQCVANQV
jgi:hypothetical protein